MMHGCGLAARCILRDHPSRSLARGHHHPSHLTLTDSSHNPQIRSPSGHQPRHIISHRQTFPPKFRNQFSAARDSSQQSVLGATLPRFPAMNMEMWPGCRHQQLLRGARGGGGLPGHHGPTAAGRGTTTGLPQHSATLTLMYLEIHNVRE